MAQVQEHSEHSAVQNMIQNLYEVAHWASSCSVRCIENPAKNMDLCARHCLDAATVATTLATLAARGSPHAGRVTECAKDVISTCGDHCSKMVGQAGDGQRTMESCAKACRQAVESMDAFIAANK